jgi:hypothetical protein
MPTKSNNNNKSSKSISASKPMNNPVTNPSHTVPTYQQPSIIDNIKAGFGLGVGSSIGARITDSIFGNRTVTVDNKTETANLQEKYLDTNSQVDKCHYIIDDIRFNKCDNNTNNDKCNELFEKFYSCHKNM